MQISLVHVLSALCFSSHHEIYRHSLLRPSALSRCTRSRHNLSDSKSSDFYTEEFRQKKLHEERIRQRRQRNLEYWGVETASSLESNTAIHPRQRNAAPTFPSTFDAVADDAFHAIQGTILGLQSPDPNAVSNAMHKSVLDYRPTHPPWSSSRSLRDEEYGSSLNKNEILKRPTSAIARMGIEIDGAAFLLSSEHSQTRDTSEAESAVRGRSTDEGKAMRILSLKLACRLANLRNDKEHAALQPVAVYYNSMRQTLLASDELRRMKHMHKGLRPMNGISDESLDCVQIYCLGQHSLPESMTRRNNRALNGVILIVKPTDYDFDSPTATHSKFDSSVEPKSRTFYPTIHPDTIDKLQSLLFQAAASSVPSVVMSPRLSELPPLQQYSTTYRYKTGPSGFEQSGFQRSATYGGCEPPVGPTSWLLRDLVPPVYVWVGCSLDLLRRATVAGQRRKALPSIESLMAQYRTQEALDNNPDNFLINKSNEGAYSFHSRVALTQSSMDAGHLYHLFAVKEVAEIAPRRLQTRRAMAHDVLWKSTYEFMGSTKSSLGRPTSEIMKDLFTEWSQSTL